MYFWFHISILLQTIIWRFTDIISVNSLCQKPSQTSSVISYPPPDLVPLVYTWCHLSQNHSNHLRTLYDTLIFLKNPRNHQQQLPKSPCIPKHYYSPPCREEQASLASCSGGCPPTVHLSLDALHGPQTRAQLGGGHSHILSAFVQLSQLGFGPSELCAHFFPC